MAQTLRSKRIRIVSYRPILPLGGTYGPVNNWYRERMLTIFLLIREGYLVDELCPDGNIVRLNKDNFATENGGEYDEEDKLRGLLIEFPPIPKKPVLPEHDNQNDIGTGESGGGNSGSGSNPGNPGQPQPPQPPQTTPIEDTPVKNNRGIVPGWNDLPFAEKMKWAHLPLKEYKKNDRMILAMAQENGPTISQIFIAIKDLPPDTPLNLDYWRNALTAEEENINEYEMSKYPEKPSNVPNINYNNDSEVIAKFGKAARFLIVEYGNYSKRWNVGDKLLMKTLPDNKSYMFECIKPHKGILRPDKEYWKYYTD